MSSENVIETDVLVIGGGVSGMFAAIKARGEGVSVTIVEKSYAGRAGGALFAFSTSIFNPEWGHNLKDWMAQIAKTGDYMNNPEMTEITLKESYDRYKDLVSWGVQFPTGPDGKPIASRSNVLEFINADWKSMLPVMRNQVLKSGAKIMDRIMVTELLKQDGRIVGAVGFHTRSGDFFIFKAKATIMCAGTGILAANGTFGSTLTTYDGEAMAYRAGAEISGKEFSISGTGAYSYAGPGSYGDRTQGDTKVSFEGKEIKDPPGNFHPSKFRFLSNYVDSEGNKVNRYTIAAATHLGRAPIFLNLYDIPPEMIEKQMSLSGPLDVDITKGGLLRVPIRFESYAGWCMHSASGISSTDTKGGTSIPGLFAAGDGYNSKSIGAKYAMAGFSTRNAMVIGSRAGLGAAEYAKKTGKITVDPAEVTRLRNTTYAPLERKSGFDQDWVTLQLKTITYPYYVWFIRHGDRLKAALTLVEFVKDYLTPMVYAKPGDAHGLRMAHETVGRVHCIEMMLRAALFRTESRGVHYREDYPFRDDPNWLAEVVIKNKNGGMELEKKALPRKSWPDLSVPYDERYPMEYLGEESVRQRK